MKSDHRARSCVASARRIARLFVLGPLLLAGASQAAESTACALPHRLAAVAVQPPPAQEIQRDVPTASYVLSLTWSPEFCRTHADDAEDNIQCKLNSFGFVVHGLWPNGPSQVDPRYCREPTLVDAAALRANLCMTPSLWLLQHEWEAHGTCAWATPQSYFAKARELRAALHIPNLTPGSGGVVTAGEVRYAFVARNPGMARDELQVDVDRANRLQEVHICYDLAFRLSACRRGGGAPDSATIFVTPKA